MAALEEQISQARERMLEINQQREALQAKVREREKAIESGRQVILRLLGEASTLKNQLAQIDEYLAGIERETARVADVKSKFPRRKSSGWKRRASSSPKPCRNGSSNWNRSPASGGARKRTGGRRRSRRRTAARDRRAEERSVPSSTRARNRSKQVLAHRTYTTESVKRLFAALEKGKAAGLKPLGVLADYVEVDAQFEKPAEEFLHEELEYVVVETWQQAERGLDFIRAELDGRATFLVHPEPNGNGHGHLPEPAIGPETGIVARLSDSLRLTNGFKDRAVDLLPRLSLCFLAEDRLARNAWRSPIRISIS